MANHRDPIWRIIWSSNLIPKIKVFVEANEGYSPYKGIGGRSFNLVAITLWTLWKNRNTYFHERRCLVHGKVTEQVGYWQHEMEAELDTSNRNVISYVVTWQPPLVGRIKVNIDVAFTALNNTVGLGVVVRDCESTIYFSAFKKVDRVRDSLMEEMLAIQFGLEMVCDNGIKVIDLVSDCLVVVSEINKQVDSSWEGA
ncbi:hypothetical protein REPUB_Repub08aG0066800 [Reevesia pubescens]